MAKEDLEVEQFIVELGLLVDKFPNMCRVFAHSPKLKSPISAIGVSKEDGFLPVLIAVNDELANIFCVDGVVPADDTPVTRRTTH